MSGKPIEYVDIKIEVTTTELDDAREAKEHDVEQGHREEENPEEVLTLMHYAETIEFIDRGCPMKAKTGVAGDTPEKDSFPFFKSSKKFVCLMWGGDVQDWRLLSFDGHRPENIYDPEQSFNATYIMLKDITEVFLEIDSNSFRLYSGENIVTRYTPQPESRDHADAWVNAIFAAMELQQTENDPKDLAELREKYLSNFEEIPPEEQNQVALADGDHGHVDLEAGHRVGGEEKERDKRRDSARTTSSGWDFSHIYGPRGTNGEENPRHKTCCLIS